MNFKCLLITLAVILAVAVSAQADTPTETPTPYGFLTLATPAATYVVGQTVQLFWYGSISGSAGMFVERQDNRAITNLYSFPTPNGTAIEATNTYYTWTVAEGYFSITKTVKFKLGGYGYYGNLYPTTGSSIVNADNFIYVFTATVTPTITLTSTKTPVSNFTRTVTFTKTPTYTRTITVSPTITKTITETATPTSTKTITQTRTATKTITLTITITNTITPTFTPSVTKTITPNWSATASPTITPTWTATTIPTMYIAYVSTDTQGNQDKIKVEFTKYTGASYTLGYGSNTEYLTSANDISKNAARFVYEIINLRTETAYPIRVSATSGDLGTTTMTSNIISVKPKASPTP